jgi:outer membrane murein-binding lipoprotein Lpp
MKKYELQYTKGEDGVFCMSLVENPATKTQLVMFDDESKLLQFQDDDKQIVYSVAMRPNMLIPRKDINGEPAMVFYTEETIADLQQNFFKKNHHNGATVNHDGKVRENMYIFESWIVQDSEKDKATLLGMQVKKGDWVTAQKIENAEVWQDVKSGKLTGFSIEAYLEPVLINNKVEMTKEEIDARIKRVLMEAQLGTKYTIEDKDYYIDKMEVGGVVTDGDGNPIPNAEMEIEKKKIKTDDKGVILEAVTEVEQEEEKPAPAEDKTAELQKQVEELTTENNDLKAKITELEAKKTEMSAEVTAAKKVALEMAEEMKKGIKPDAKVEPTELEKFKNRHLNK